MLSVAVAASCTAIVITPVRRVENSMGRRLCAPNEACISPRYRPGCCRVALKCQACAPAVYLFPLVIAVARPSKHNLVGFPNYCGGVDVEFFCCWIEYLPDSPYVSACMLLPVSPWEGAGARRPCWVSVVYGMGLLIVRRCHNSPIYLYLRSF